VEGLKNKAGLVSNSAFQFITNCIKKNSLASDISVWWVFLFASLHKDYSDITITTG